jgi:oligopeptide transport system permease protein
MHILPGDPILIYISSGQLKDTTDEEIAALRHQYGLDKPLPAQYVQYLGNILKGDLGESMITPGRTANKIISETFPASARLGLQSIAVGLVIGLILGIIAAFNRNSWADYLVMFIAIIGVSVPSFVLASVLQYTFTYLVPLFPTIGWPTKHLWTSGFEYTVLPTIALSFASIAVYARYMRTSVLDVVNQDYILTAKAKGVPRNALIWKHVIRNALLPIITILGPQIAGLITGTFVVETIFMVPGMGSYFVSSISSRDYTLIMATTIFYSFLYVASLIIVDILYGVVDPRIRITGGKR